MASRPDLESRVADLRSRRDALLRRTDAHTYGQRANIVDLEDKIADAERALSSLGGTRPDDLVWYVPSRPGFVDGVAVKFPWLGVRRSGQAVRWLGTPNGAKPTVRARVADNYEILIDGAPAPTRLLTRREASYQAHLGVAGGGTGRLPAALRLRGRALAKFLHDYPTKRARRNFAIFAACARRL